MNPETLRHLYLRRIIAPALSVLGRGPVERLAVALGRRVYELGTPGRRIAEARLRLSSPATATPRAVSAVARSMYEHLGRFWTEAIFLRRTLRASSWRNFVDVPREPALRALAQSGRGCLLATAYFGNPAAAAVALGEIFRPVYVIADYLAQPMLAAWQRELYSLPRVRPVTRTDAPRLIPRVLSSGGAVLMIAEQERRRGRGVEVDFLGARRRCYPTLDRLARWHRASVAAVVCRRNQGNMSFTLELLDAVEPENAPVDAGDDGGITRRIMAALERAIRQNPDQYLWSIPDAASRRLVMDDVSVRVGHGPDNLVA